MTLKYKVKSFEYTAEPRPACLFTIEECGTHGEIRLFADDLLANATVLKHFDKADIARITYVAETAAAAAQNLPDETSLEYALQEI